MTTLMIISSLFHISFTYTTPPDPRSSENALKYYLSRAQTVEAVLCEQITEPSIKANTSDSIRMLHDIGTRYAGRAVYTWGQEQNIAKILPQAKSNANKIHANDPYMILEGAIFEIVTQTGVQTIHIPPYVFKAFDQPVINRTFNYTAMLFPDGTYVNHWGSGSSVPDMTQLETRLWFFYVGTQYMNIGIEALHCGQIMLMSKQDKGMVMTYQLLDKLRMYAASNARRGWVLCNAHLYQDPWVHLNGTQQLIWDLHAFPSRPDAQPNKSGEQCILKVNFEDAMYKKSAGGIAVAGWKTNNLPYMVELDNYGCTNHPGQQWKNDTYHPFGYDEITWFAQQPDTYRNEWLQYVATWLVQNDPVGHFEMPGLRPICYPTVQSNETFYDASKDEPYGFAQEDTIANIWSAQNENKID
eukprot:185369_1